MITKAISIGFLAGIGFMASQDMWWALKGMVGFCRG